MVLHITTEHITAAAEDVARLWGAVSVVCEGARCSSTNTVGSAWVSVKLTPSCGSVLGIVRGTDTGHDVSLVMLFIEVDGMMTVCTIFDLNELQKMNEQ